MPKQNRWRLKRFLDLCCEDIARAQAHLASVYVEFEPVHPEEAAYLDTFGRALGEVSKLVARFKDEEI